MISVTPEFKTVAKALVHTPCAKLVCTDGYTTATFTKNQIQSFDIERSACASDTYTLGSTVAATFNATILTSALAVFDTLEQLKVTAYLGYVVNGEEVYLQEGVYYLDDSQTQNQGLFTSVQGYDLFMKKGMDTTVEPAFITALDGANTPYQAFAALASVYSNLSFDYSAVPDTGDILVLIDGTMSLRTVLSRLAVGSGCNLIVAPDETITCVYPTIPTESTVDTGLVLTTQSYKSCDIDGRDKTYVGYLTCEVEGDDGSETVQYPETIPGDNAVGLEFDNTYFTTAAALSTVYERAIPSGVNPDTGYRCLAYQGHSLEARGLPYAEPLDGVSATRRKPDGTDETFYLLPLTVKHSYNGAIKTTFSAKTIQQNTSVSSSTSAQTAATTKAISSRLATLRGQTVAIYGACSTTELLQEKTVNIAGFNLFTGVAISVKFQYVNSAQNPTLNINNTGAFPIYANDKQLSYPSPYSWKAGQTVRFVFANNTWIITDANPANFCDFVSDGQGGRILQISADADANGFHTDIGANQIALKYGSTSQLEINSNAIIIGANETQQMVLDSTGLTLTNNDASLVMTTTTDSNDNVHSIMQLSSGASASMTTIDDSQLSTATVQHQQAKFTNASSAPTTPNYVLEKRRNGHLSIKVY